MLRKGTSWQICSNMFQVPKINLMLMNWKTRSLTVDWLPWSSVNSYFLRNSFVCCI